MPVEVGAILVGKVVSIKPFGAFINLPEGKSGLCHISEVAEGFVKKVEDHLELNQEVKVKVIKIDDKGKISLSIKQAIPPEQRPSRPAPRREPRPSAPQKPKGFEDMLTDFIKTSDDKLKGVKSKKSRRGNGYNTRK